MHRLIKLKGLWAWLAVVFGLLVLTTGCSDDVRPEPAELNSFVPQIEVKRHWSRSTGGGQDGQLFQYRAHVDSSAVYAMSYDGDVYRFDTGNGDESWSVDLDRPLIGGIGGDRSKIYVTTENGELIGLHKEDGAVAWEVGLPSEVLAPAAAALGKVIVNSVNGKITSYSADTGEKLWEYAASEPSLSLRGSSPPVIVQDAVLSGLSNGTVIALSLEDGQLFWEQRVASPKGKTELERLIDVDGDVVVDGSAIYAVAYQGQLSKLGLFNGKVEWTIPVSSRMTPTLGFTNIYVTTVEGDVVAYDTNSQREVWRQTELSYRELTNAVPWGNYLLVGDLDGYVHILSQLDGSFAARIRPAGDFVAVGPIVLDEGFLVLGSDGKLSLWSLAEAGS